MIWCVEDDASIRDIEIYALRAAGFEVRGFPDGDSFWDALQQQRPDLVVLDVMLPGADGTELLRRMRATPSVRVSSGREMWRNRCRVRYRFVKATAPSSRIAATAAKTTSVSLNP